MNKQILIIDDEEVTRRFVQRVLLKNNYLVETLKDGTLALDIIKRNKFDIIIVDLKMPKIDGFEIIREIKKLDFNPSIIIVTGFLTAESKIKAKELGVKEILIKPFTITTLLNSINSLNDK